MTKPKYEVNIEEDVLGLGEIVYVTAPFDKGLGALKRNGAVQISLRDLAYARIKLGEGHSVSENSSWVKEGVLLVPNSEHRRILLRDSLVAKHPMKATNAHRDSGNYSVSKNESDEVIEKAHSNDDSVYVLKDLSSVPTNRLGDDERTVWLFGNVAEKYGHFLKESGIEELPFWFDNDGHIDDNHEKPYANQLWFGKLYYDSGIDCDSNKVLDSNERVRGVLVSGEGDEKNQKGLQEKIDDILKMSMGEFVPSVAMSDYEAALREILE